MLRRSALIGGAALLASPSIGRAEAGVVRLSHGYSVNYLPLMVLRDRGLLEAHAKRLGVGAVETQWRTLDGGNTINDAMLSGALDIAGIGATGFITLWAKAYGGQSAVIGVSNLGNGATWLNTNRPGVTSIRQIGPGDKIAVPGIKTSYAATVLQMAAAKEFGIENFAKLDPFTVGIPHPEALAALTSGKTEITFHMASPPFSQQELTFPGIHRVFTTADLFGVSTILIVFAPKRFTDANPGLMQAYLAAMDEACAFIAADKGAAAETYLRVTGLKMQKPMVQQLLEDPETTYTVAPLNITAYSDFLSATGLVKRKPASWKDLFIPQLHDRQGS